MYAVEPDKGGPTLIWINGTQVRSSHLVSPTPAGSSPSPGGSGPSASPGSSGAAAVR
jgi:hypothetical protein